MGILYASVSPKMTFQAGTVESSLWKWKLEMPFGEHWTHWSHSILHSSSACFSDYWPPVKWVVYNFGCVCLSVCMYVCRMITVESLDVVSSYLHMWYIATLHGRVRIWRSLGQAKVTGAKKVENSLFLFPQYTLIGKIIPALSNAEHSDVCVRYGVFGYSGLNGVTAIFVMWPQLNTRN